MTSYELEDMSKLAWMPSRIPVLDALAATFPKGMEIPEGLIPPSHEQRWYPQQGDALRLLVPYSGGEYDSSVFHIEPKAWDHTTCDQCATRIPAMTICYVTKFDPYICLCSSCYRKYVVHKSHIGKLALWYGKRLIGINASA